MFRFGKLTPTILCFSVNWLFFPQEVVVEDTVEAKEEIKMEVDDPPPEPVAEEAPKVLTSPQSHVLAGPCKLLPKID